MHKFDRYLHPGRVAVASFVGPQTWGAVPVLFFQEQAPALENDADAMVDGEVPTAPSSAPLQLIGTGTVLPPSQRRIIAKRVILTGHPFKIHKRLVTVRYMFFNYQDVKWFQSLPLWTRRGRSGFIKESLGTRGYFKATFDGKISPMDVVAISLYKRMWPRQAAAWHDA